ncbi:hypothetical protein KIW84_023805 [Lathyrus oleraceus]|uniref:Reverse transcriptase RNase H-like domain-containing protein n=1 Tax=Pisum sativum TaxID=3888 RepID=A0A9D4YFY2_PEA|nr:hypothetical protein KIW84_023805 [Pisum sativum]
MPPVEGRPLIMYLTVLENSMGCVLGQHDESGRKEHAIYHLSKKFTDCETRYSLLEKTCCALAWAARRLRQGKWTPTYKRPFVVKKVFSGGAMMLATMDDEDSPHPVNTDIVKKILRMYTRQVENLKGRLGKKRVSWWTENLKRRSRQKLGIKAYDYVPFSVYFTQVKGTEQANHFYPTAGDERLEDIMTVVDLKSMGLFSA